MLESVAPSSCRHSKSALRRLRKLACDAGRPTSILRADATRRGWPGQPGHDEGMQRFGLIRFFLPPSGSCLIAPFTIRHSGESGRAFVVPRRSGVCAWGGVSVCVQIALSGGSPRAMRVAIMALPAQLPFLAWLPPKPFSISSSAGFQKHSTPSPWAANFFPDPVWPHPAARAAAPVAPASGRRFACASSTEK